VTKPSLRLQRTTVLLVAGLSGLAYETIAEHADRPTLIVAFLGLCGLPVFLKADEKLAAPSAPPPAAAVPPPTVNGGS
jgi:allophanate hydrolase subunit 1